MKKLLAGASLVTVGVLIAIVLPASSQVSGQTLRVCDPNNQGFEHTVDVGRDDISAGDTSQFIDKAFDSQTGDPAGKFVGNLTVIRTFPDRRDALVHIDVTYFSNRGKISVDATGTFGSFADGVHFPITGGSGNFRTAGGQALAKEGFCQGHRGLRLRIHVVNLA
jgi:hypothetical protein